ncbi:MAG TPA: Hsp70 family protein, partial [Solirubrobacteraceae bacterium]|nr:Hsp70 family protein [Solirubrobacteraceae bacterium]
RNNGENAAYQAERQLVDLGDQVDADSKGRIEAAVKEVREALESEDPAAINAKAEALQVAFHSVSEAMYERAQQQQAATGDGASTGDGSGSAGSSDEEDVVDAEVVDEPQS